MYVEYDPEEMKLCDMRFGTFDEWLGQFYISKTLSVYFTHLSCYHNVSFR